jgi:integrase
MLAVAATADVSGNVSRTSLGSDAMSRQINRLTEAAIKAARPREVIMSVTGVAENVQYPDHRDTQRPFTLDAKAGLVSNIVNAKDRPAKVRAEKKFKAALRTMVDPSLMMRNGKPVRIKFKNKLYPDGGGLYLEVSGEHDGRGGVSIRKSWLFRYAVPGETVISRTGKTRQRERAMGLGPLHTVDLGLARDKARQARQLLLDGIDPLEQRRARKSQEAIKAAKLQTFDQARDAFVLKMGIAWKNRHHARDWVSSLERHVTPVIGALPVADIDDDLVCKVLEPIWTRIPTTAQSIRGRIEKILDFARTTGKRPIHEPNPARWKGHLANIFAGHREIAPVKHHPRLPWNQMPTLWHRLTAVDSMGSKALRFLILTGTPRSGTLRKALWDEIEIESNDVGTWHIPGSHMKEGKALRIALAAPAIALLDELDPDRTLRRDKGRIFPIGATAMDRCLKRIRNDVVVHGLRGTFSDWGNDNGFSRDLIEEALGHAVGNSVERAYKQTDVLGRRRPLMDAWGAFVTGTASGENIIPMSGRRA